LFNFETEILVAGELFEIGVELIYAKRIPLDQTQEEEQLLMKVVYFSYYVALTLTKTFKGFLIQVGDAGGVGEFFFDYEVCKFEVFKPLGKFTHLEFGPKNYLEIEILDKLQ